jgi:hypothetical protein
MPIAARELYDRHFASKGFERVDLFELLVDHFGVRRALYPGSFVHVSPSFVIRSVTYVDNDSRCPRFFADPAVVRMVKKRRRYHGEPEIAFHAADYSEPLEEEDESFDLLISQWAGPISHACKRYLKVGGILVANDSHGDASLASLDRHYQLVAVITRGAGKHRLSERSLDTFFVPKSGKPVTRQDIERTRRGGAYVKSAAAYVLRRTR